MASLAGHRKYWKLTADHLMAERLLAAAVIDIAHKFEVCALETSPERLNALRFEALRLTQDLASS